MNFLGSNHWLMLEQFEYFSKVVAIVSRHFSFFLIRKQWLRLVLHNSTTKHFHLFLRHCNIRLQFIRNLYRLPRTQQHRDFVGYRLWTLHRHHVQQLPASRRQTENHPMSSPKGCQHFHTFKIIIQSRSISHHRSSRKSSRLKSILDSLNRVKKK